MSIPDCDFFAGADLLPVAQTRIRAVPAACPGAFTRARIGRFCDALHAYPGSRIITPDLHTNSVCHANTMIPPKYLVTINSPDPSKQPVTTNQDLTSQQLVTVNSDLVCKQNVTGEQAIRSKQNVTIPGPKTSVIHANKLLSLLA